MALGRIDYYVLKPERSPDELFHRTVADFLFEWARAESPVQGEIEIVAETESPRAHDLRACSAATAFPTSATRRVARRPRPARRGRHRAPSVPVARVQSGEILVDPSNVELAAAFGVSTELGEDRGSTSSWSAPARPASPPPSTPPRRGCARSSIERESLGGQAGSSSLIRNYLGFSRGVSGSDLAQRAYQQAWVFGTSFLLMKEVVELRPGEPRHTLRISDGSEVEAIAVVIASGVSYRRLGSPPSRRSRGPGVFYGASGAEAKALSGRRAYVVGGGNSSGQAAMHLARYAERVTLVVRGASLAESMSAYLREEIDAADNVDVMLESEVVDGRRRRPPRVADAARQGGRRDVDRRRRRAVRDDRRPAGDRVAAAGDRARRAGLRPHRDTTWPGSRDRRGRRCRGRNQPAATSSRSATSATARSRGSPRPSARGRS